MPGFFRRSPEASAHSMNQRMRVEKTPRSYADNEPLEVMHEDDEQEPLVPELATSETEEHDVDHFSPLEEFLYERDRARQPHDKGRDDRHRPRPERFEAPVDEVEAQKEKDRYTPEGIDSKEFEIPMHMEQVAEEGLEALDLEMLIDWMDRSGRVSFSEKDRPQMMNRFENLKALLDVPLIAREHQDPVEEKTVGEAVRTCLKALYDFHQKNKEALTKIGLDAKDTSASDQLAKFLALWIRWYGQIYNTGLNHEMTKQEAHEGYGAMSNFTDGLAKCLESFDLHIENLADRVLDSRSAFALRQEIRKVYKTFGKMIDHIPYETPETEKQNVEYRKRA